MVYVLVTEVPETLISVLLFVLEIGYVISLKFYVFRVSKTWEPLIFNQR